jgi:hypothetical protein
MRPQLVQTVIGAIGTSYGSRRVHSARSAQLGQRNRPAQVGERALSARVNEWNMAVQPPRAHIVERGAKKMKKVAESQRVHEWNMLRARSVSVRRA